MPHVIIKLLVGRSDEQKSRLAADVTRAVTAAAGCGEEAVSVSIEDIEPDRWTADVYEPDIAARWDNLHKRPGYGPKAGT